MAWIYSFLTRRFSEKRPALLYEVGRTPKI